MTLTALSRFPASRPRRYLPFAILMVLLLTGGIRLSQAQPRTPDDILATLTLEQKVAQMFLVGLYGPTLNQPGEAFLRQYQPGGVVLFESNAGSPADVTALVNQWQQTVTGAGGLPLFVATDQEGGTIARLKDGFTTWPVPMLLTASGDVNLAYRTGQAMATELRAVGVNLNLAPVADLYTNLNNPVIGRRSFGSDPNRTGQILGALVRGMQAGGVLATAKHFPGHGDTDQDSHTALPVVRYTRDELEQVEFVPFRWTIAAGVEAMMVAHIWYPALDPDEPLPASLSPNIITGLLREEMSFRGLIMTDAIEMDAIDTRYTYGEAAILAINAGVDLVAFGAHLNPNQQAEAIKTVVSAVGSGQLTEARIDDSVRRILDAKQRYGVLDWQPQEPGLAIERVNAADHSTLVADIFNAGVTIAYDRQKLLPLTDGRTVTVIYPGSRPSIKNTCGAYAGSQPVRWLAVSDSPGTEEITTAASTARLAEVVIVFTQNAGSNDAQRALVNALPRDKTAAVALFSPYDWQAFPDVAAYLTTYSPLDPGIPAACAVIFGARPATGQLPVALDGQRDFASFVATEGIAITGVAIAFAATPTPLPPTLVPTVMPTETDVPPPSLTPTVTETRPPLPTGTRELVVIPPTITPLPPTSTLTITAPAEVGTAIAAFATLPPNPVNPPPAAILPPVDTLPLLPVGIGLIGLAVTLYGGLFVSGTRAVNRYRRGFVIQRCPVCQQGKLHVETTTRRFAGIPYVTRRTVRCKVCRSVLRESGARRWKYHINRLENPTLHDRLHDRVVDEATLRGLGR